MDVKVWLVEKYGLEVMEVEVWLVEKYRLEVMDVEVWLVEKYRLEVMDVEGDWLKRSMDWKWWRLRVIGWREVWTESDGGLRHSRPFAHTVAGLIIYYVTS